MLVPKLRFKCEDGTEYPEWGNKSFANAFAPLNNNTFSRDMLSENGTVLNIHYGDILVKFGEVCDIQAMDIPKVNAEIDTSKYDELQDGDIILADTAEDETVGKAIEIYHTGTSKVVSGLHTMACRPNDKYAPKYMGYYINSPTYHNQLLPFMQGIKVTSIGRKNIADTEIYYPADLEEQKKIADFLSTVDEVIAQSEAEVQNLEQQKKAAMQKIFSQEVRFKREDGADYPEWEKCCFSYLIKGKISNGLFTETSKLGRGVKLINVSDLYNEPFINYEALDLLDVDEKTLDNNRVQPNDLLFTRSSVKASGVAHCNIYIGNDFDVVFDGHIMKASIDKSKAIPLFVKYLMDSPNARNKTLQKAKTGAFTTIGQEDLESVPLVMSFCLEEQQKIADFISAYDEAISYAKQELDKWKELKKGLLQQMFV